jgi:hypothetical protein
METSKQPPSVDRVIAKPQPPLGYILYQEGVLEFMPYNGEDLVECFRPLPVCLVQKPVKIEISKAGRPIKASRSNE